MKWHALCGSLALLLLATPALAVEAVPFAGFSGIVLGTPGTPTADVPARSFTALFALAEYGGPTRIGAQCEIETPDEEALTLKRRAPRLKVLVTLVREDGTVERAAQLKMRLDERFVEASRVRELTVRPGDYLLFEFRLKGRARIEAGEQLILLGFAGAPDQT